ncbi:MAG: hypothetical protein EBQ96_06210 [Proteobacteria bacterium]|nr:hypothetical protein [Pseudomonadota bacterium]
MLRGKMYRDFKDIENCLLIIGGIEDYRAAAEFLQNHKSSTVFFKDVVSLEGGNETDGRQLTFMPHEIQEFREVCINLSSHEKPVHHYMSKDSIELLISCGEYDHFPS